MKKLIMFVGVLLVVLFCSGCGGTKVLDCKQNASGVDVDFKVTFNGKKLEKMEFGYDMDLSSYNQTQIDAISKVDYCSVVKKSMPQYANAIANCKQDVASQKLLVSAEFDISKFSKTQLNTLESPEKAKSDLESTGYKCTLN